MSVQTLISFDRACTTWRHTLHLNVLHQAMQMTDPEPTPRVVVVAHHVEVGVVCSKSERI
jgi:hypothetical protein